jgi:hypothetical protein
MTERLIVGVYGSARLPDSDPRWVAAGAVTIHAISLGAVYWQIHEQMQAIRKELKAAQARSKAGNEGPPEEAVPPGREVFFEPVPDLVRDGSTPGAARRPREGVSHAPNVPSPASEVVTAATARPVLKCSYTVLQVADPTTRSSLDPGVEVVAPAQTADQSFHNSWCWSRSGRRWATRLVVEDTDDSSVDEDRRREGIWSPWVSTLHSSVSTK